MPTRIPPLKITYGTWEPKFTLAPNPDEDGDDVYECWVGPWRFVTQDVDDSWPLELQLHADWGGGWWRAELPDDLDCSTATRMVENVCFLAGNGYSLERLAGELEAAVLGTPEEALTPADRRGFELIGLMVQVNRLDDNTFAAAAPLVDEWTGTFDELVVAAKTIRA